MGDIDTNALKIFATKYIWWKTPVEAIKFPQRVIAQVMNIGDYTDVQKLVKQVGDDVLRDVLNHAEAGQFSTRSWHYRLRLSVLGEVPLLPVRRIA
jgi:hypothetical protein